LLFLVLGSISFALLFASTWYANHTLPPASIHRRLIDGITHFIPFYDIRYAGVAADILNALPTSAAHYAKAHVKRSHLQPLLESCGSDPKCLQNPHTLHAYFAVCKYTGIAPSAAAVDALTTLTRNVVEWKNMPSLTDAYFLLTTAHDQQLLSALDRTVLPNLLSTRMLQGHGAAFDRPVDDDRNSNSNATSLLLTWRYYYLCDYLGLAQCNRPTADVFRQLKMLLSSDHGFVGHLSSNLADAPSSTCLDTAQAVYIILSDGGHPSHRTAMYLRACLRLSSAGIVMAPASARRSWQMTPASDIDLEAMYYWTQLYASFSEHPAMLWTRDDAVVQMVRYGGIALLVAALLVLVDQYVAPDVKRVLRWTPLLSGTILFPSLAWIVDAFSGRALDAEAAWYAVMLTAGGLYCYLQVARSGTTTKDMGIKVLASLTCIQVVVLVSIMAGARFALSSSMAIPLSSVVHMIGCLLLSYLACIRTVSTPVNELQFACAAAWAMQLSFVSAAILASDQWTRLKTTLQMDGSLYSVLVLVPVLSFMAGQCASYWACAMFARFNLGIVDVRSARTVLKKNIFRRVKQQ
jgi:hypothetical protein